LNIHYTTQFKKDYKRIKKQNKDLSKLRTVIEKLSSGKLLEPTYRDHTPFQETGKIIEIVTLSPTGY
jgi:mRNA interferase YafQ